MVTGRVVGVLQRNRRDYVASIQEDDVNSRSLRVSARFSENCLLKNNTMILDLNSCVLLYVRLVQNEI